MVRRPSRSARPDPARAPRAGGFTLLEVMVALALLAAALMAVADLCGNALRNHGYARDLSEATLLARAKMAELEQTYEDLGFKDFDESDEGDFREAGRADMKWRVDLLRPNADLSADQLVSMLSGAGGDAQDLITTLMGGAAASAGTSTTSSSSGPSQPTLATGGLAAGALGKMIQSQVTVFGETLKKSFREMRLTVGWYDGTTPHAFTVTTHLVVLNPRAPGGARGNDPEVPPNLAATPATAGVAGLPGVPGAAGGVPGMPGVSGMPAVPGVSLAPAVPTAPVDTSNLPSQRRRRRGGATQ